MSTPAYLGNPHDSYIWQELADALDAAMTQHPAMHSPHEGHGVIAEELDELWEHVRGICDDHCNGRSPMARKEAIQIAAMGLRYALDLCSGGLPLMSTPDPLAAQPLTEEEIAALRPWHAKGTTHADLTPCDEFCDTARWLSTLDATRPSGDAHEHRAEYPSSCTGCEHLAADLASRLPEGLLPTRAGRSDAGHRQAVHDAIERIVENELTGVPAWRYGLTNRLTDAALASGEASPDPLREALRAIPRHTTPDGEETYIEWAAVRDLIGEASPDPVWLIERGQPEGQTPTVWWTGSEWTEDANAALRFPDKTAALAYVAPDRRLGRVVEHIFLAASPDPAPRPEDARDEAECVCGRDIFRPWIEGVQEPWKHWVEPLDHKAEPRESGS